MNNRAFPSLAANLLIQHSNPGNDSSSRFVWAHYNRNMHKTIFNLIWKTIYDGMKKSIGINKK
jgi:hypothetical protein